MCCLLGIEAEFASSVILGFIMSNLPGASAEYQDVIAGLLESSISMIVIVVFLAPVFEELLFRLLILSVADRFLPFYAANIIQAVLFGMYHGNPVQGIYAFILGLYIGCLRKWTGTVISCLGFHIAFNVTGWLLDAFMPTDLSLIVRIIIVVVAIAGMSQGTYLLTHFAKMPEKTG